MCGFSGFLGGLGLAQPESKAMLKRMADTIANRGPDDAGYWSDVEHRIGLGHRRLSIVDLSPAGHQPLPSARGRYGNAFNGEI
jgi:asparagine synthase (glutamine-hydrolysing)